jgi:hypothetical protein
MRAVWAIYALLPLILIPSALGTYAYLRNKSNSLAVAGIAIAF